MTSEHTMQSTKDFFSSHQYFGLQADNVIFFEQHMLPCVTFEGKVILEQRHKIARAPGKAHEWQPPSVTSRQFCNNFALRFSARLTREII